MSVDPAEIQQRFDRLTEILGDIVTSADAQAAHRCPYRDRHDRCTARFRCRNQAEPADGPPESAAAEATATGAAAPAVLRCTHDGTFDYRSAWESDPRAAATARRRLDRQRRRLSTAADGPRADTDAGAPAPHD